MPDLGKLAEFGVAGLALVVVLVLVLALVDIFRKKLFGKESASIIECPNKIEGLSATLVALSNESREQTRLNTEQLKVLTRNHEGIGRLVEQHKPDTNGREMWKWTTRSEQIQEESRDLLREIARSMQRRNGVAKRG